MSTVKAELTDILPPVVPPTTKTKIEPASPNVPEFARDFLGEYQGKWWKWGSPDCGRRYYVLFTLYVTKVEMDKGAIKATITYAWGKSEERVKDSGWVECVGSIEQSEDNVVTLKIERENGRKMKFFFENHKLQGRVLNSGAYGIIVLTNMPKIR